MKKTPNKLRAERGEKKLCACGSHYWCRRCKRWVANGWVCREHADETSK